MIRGARDRRRRRGRLVAKPHDRLGGGRIGPLLGPGQDLVAKKVAGELRIRVRGVLTPAFSLGLEESPAERPRQMEERPQERDAVGEPAAAPHARKAREPRAAQGAMQDCLGLVVGRVPHDDVPGAVPVRRVDQKRIPQPPRPRLEPLAALRGIIAHGQ